MAGPLTLGSFALLGGAGAALGVIHPNSPLFGRVISRGSRRERVAYLTFDDGPNPRATPAILDTLAETSVPAAFFLVGRHVERFPGLAIRAHEAGHELANHTSDHRRLLWCGPRTVAEAIETAHAQIGKAVGAVPRAFRAPYGMRNPFVPGVTRRLGYATFGWSITAWDWRRPGAEIIRRRVARALHPGAIILLHDGDGTDPTGDRSQTAAALPGIIQDAREQGYRFGALGELLPAEAAG